MTPSPMQIDPGRPARHVATLLLLAASVGVAHAEPASPPWFPNGPVYVTHRDGEKLYVGGRFDYVGPLTGSGTEVDLGTSLPRARAPLLDGSVYAVVADDSGGWYVGGDFTRAGGLARRNFAHVLEDGSIGSLMLEPDGAVWSLCFHRGALYVAGAFREIREAERGGLAALDVATDELLPWDPRPDYLVEALLGHEDRLYVAGRFTRLAGADRRCLAAFRAFDRELLDWNPGANGSIRSLAVDADRLYVGGDFYDLGGGSRYLVGAIDHGTGAVIPWATSIHHEQELVSASVYAVAVIGDRVFFAGDFRWVNGGERRGLAAIDRSTGALLPWEGRTRSPDLLPCRSSIGTMRVRNNVLYVAGLLDTGCSQFDVTQGVLALDAQTGMPTGEFAACGGWPRTFALGSGPEAFVGGEFVSAGGVPRSCSYALNLETGAATRWNPVTAGGSVLAIETRQDRVYLGGEFSDVNGGAWYSYFARVDSATGQLDRIPFRPSAPVLALEFVGDDLILGGGFSNVSRGSSRYTRRGLAAVSADLEVRNWSCDVTGVVEGLEFDGTHLYLGGFFSAVRGLPRNRVARIDPVSATPDAWDPNADGPVYDIVVTPERVYLAGGFQSVGGTSRRGVAAVDAGSGSILPWNPGSKGTMRVLVEQGDRVYFGGHVTPGTYYSESLPWLHAVDRDSGAHVDWQHGAGGYIYSLDSVDGKLLAGGQFGSISGQPQPNLAYLPTPAAIPDLVGVEPRGPGSLRILGLFPNPTTSHVDLRLELPAPGAVHLRVVDVAGRSRRPGRTEVLAEGVHDLRVGFDELPPGVYWLRVESGARVETRRIVVSAP